MSNQACNELGTPGVAKSFLIEAQILKLCPIVFNYAQQIFPGGAKRFAGKASHPFPRGYGPVSNSFKVCPTYFSWGAEIFLASYRPGFAP